MINQNLIINIKESGDKKDVPPDLCPLIGKFILKKRKFTDIFINLILKRKDLRL